MRSLRVAILVLTVAAALPSGVQAQEAPTSAPAVSPLLEQALNLHSREASLRLSTIYEWRKRGMTDVVPVLIQVLRFSREESGEVADTLRHLTGADIASNDWHDWMLWQEAHTEIEPFEGFDRYFSALMSSIDPQFRRFLYPNVPHEIRLEEIAWGGVMVDGIPSLDNPPLINAEEADYLSPTDLVFGVEINGDARAYPLRILNWHEMFNDVIGGEPVALAYCTLCGSGILYKTNIPETDSTFVFGSSGFLYRSNKLMFDRQTESLWNQFTGRPVVGPLVGSGIQLEILPVAITTWAEWRAANPHTRVLSLETGHRRDYSSGAAYTEYFASPELMFPARTDDARLAPKSYVFGVRLEEGTRAWPLDAFSRQRVINDTVGTRHVVLVGNRAGRTVRAYEAKGRDFRAGARTDSLIAGEEKWTIHETHLSGPDNQQLDRLPGHVAFWFAWIGYSPDSTLYQE